MLETTGEIDSVLSELDLAKMAAKDSRQVEKVLMRSREVKLRNIRCTYSMPKEPQLFLGDGNVLAVNRAGKTFKSVEDVLDVVAEWLRRWHMVAGSLWPLWLSRDLDTCPNKICPAVASDPGIVQYFVFFGQGRRKTLCKFQ